MNRGAGGEIGCSGAKNLQRSRKTNLRIIVLVTTPGFSAAAAVVSPVTLDRHRRHPELWVPNFLGVNVAEIAPGRLDHRQPTLSALGSSVLSLKSREA